MSKSLFSIGFGVMENYFLVEHKLNFDLEEILGLVIMFWDCWASRYAVVATNHCITSYITTNRHTLPYITINHCILVHSTANQYTLHCRK